MDNREVWDARDRADLIEVQLDNQAVLSSLHPDPHPNFSKVLKQTSDEEIAWVYMGEITRNDLRHLNKKANDAKHDFVTYQ